MDTQTSASSSQERKAYEPASVKVIEVSTQRVLCDSTHPIDTYPGHDLDDD